MKFVYLIQFFILNFKNRNTNNHLRAKRIELMTAKADTMSIRRAAMRPKTPAAPLFAAKFLLTITNPLASAKSAIHQMANQTKVKKLNT